MLYCGVARLVYVACLVQAVMLMVQATPFDQQPSASSITVHLVPHSHVDHGWRDTVDEYRNGAFDILDRVCKALVKEPSRRFVWAEFYYLRDWLELSSENKAVFSKLLQAGQMELVNGGLISPDEALSHIDAVVENMRLGHEVAEQLLHVRPRIGFQIDPFGHSSRVASVYASMGYDTLIIGRLHHRLHKQLSNEKALDFVWKERGTGMFTHVLDHHYSYPLDIELTHPGSVRSHVVDNLVNYARSRASSRRTPHLLFLMGDDMRYTHSAESRFNAMDKLIREMNKVNGVRARYSTLAEFTSSMRRDFHGAMPSWVGDFFPYEDTTTDNYWTGYYSSRPHLKALIRHAQSSTRNALQAAAQSTASQPPNVEDRLAQCAREVAVLHHHDAITGTCGSRAAEDYISRADKAANQAQEILRSVLDPTGTPSSTKAVSRIESAPAQLAITSTIARAHETIVKFQLSVSIFKSAICVVDADGNAVPAQINAPAIDYPVAELVFSIKFVGAGTLFVTVTNDCSASQAAQIVNRMAVSSQTVGLSNGKLRVMVSKAGKARPAAHLYISDANSPHRQARFTISRRFAVSNRLVELGSGMYILRWRPLRFVPYWIQLGIATGTSFAAVSFLLILGQCAIRCLRRRKAPPARRRRCCSPRTLLENMLWISAAFALGYLVAAVPVLFMSEDTQIVCLVQGRCFLADVAGVCLGFTMALLLFTSPTNLIRLALAPAFVVGAIACLHLTPSLETSESSMQGTTWTLLDGPVLAELHINEANPGRVNQTIGLHKAGQLQNVVLLQSQVLPKDDVEDWLRIEALDASLGDDYWTDDSRRSYSMLRQYPANVFPVAETALLQDSAPRSSIGLLFERSTGLVAYSNKAEIMLHRSPRANDEKGLQDVLKDNVAAATPSHLVPFAGRHSAAESSRLRSLSDAINYPASVSLVHEANKGLISDHLVLEEGLRLVSIYSRTSSLGKEIHIIVESLLERTSAMPRDHPNGLASKALQHYLSRAGISSTHCSEEFGPLFSSNISLWGHACRVIDQQV